MGIKDEGWEKFTRCYTITLKCWDEFNANFILLYFSSYRSIKIWDFYTKNVEKKKQGNALRLLFAHLHFTYNQNLFNINKHLALVLKKNVHVLSCVFQTNLNKSSRHFLCTIRMDQKYTNDAMFYYYKDLDENLAWLTQNTEESKCNKGISTSTPLFQGYSPF